MIITILGRPKTGKTSIISEIIEINKREDRLFLIYDLLGNFKQYYTFDGKHIKQITRFDTISHDEFFKLAYDTKNCTCFFDEIDIACNAHKIDEALFKIINYGRNVNFNVSLISAARRPARVSRDLTAASSKFIILRCREPADLKYLSEQVSPDVVTIVQNLKLFQYIVYDLDEDFEPENVKIYNTKQREK